MKHREKGIISVFLALIMLPTYIFSIGSLDFARIYAGKSYLRLADEAALSSLVLSYNKKLFEEYDLLAVSGSIEAENLANQVVVENLSTSDKSENFNRFTNIQSSLILKEDSVLNNPEEMERQIADYMRLKAPLELTKGFMNLFDTVKNAKVYNNILSKKMDYNEELSKFNKGLVSVENQLKTYNTQSITLRDKLNEFNTDSNLLSTYISKKLQANKDLESKEEKSVEDLELIASNNLSISKRADEYLEKHLALKSQVDNHLKLLESLSSSIATINNRNDKLDQNLKAWEDSIKNSPSDELKKQFQSEFTFSNKAFSKGNVNQILKKLEADKSTLQTFLSKYFSEEGVFARFSDNNKLYSLLLVNEEETKNLQITSLDNSPLYKTLLSNKSKISNPQENKNEAISIKKLLDNFNNNENKQEQIPDNLFNYISRDEFQTIVQSGPSRVSDSNKLTSIKNLRGINDSLSNLNLDKNQRSEEFINNFYISQYIAEKFSDKTIELDGKIMGQKEFILFGSDDLAANIKKAAQIIFAMRFAINTLYAFTSPQVRKDALFLASSLAGWTGIGVPIVEAILITSMSFGESILDTRKLSNGENLGLFKNRSSWTFSIDGIKRLAAEQATNIATKGISNIMDSLEQVAMEATKSSFETLNQFITQTGDGVIQGLTGSIVLPIQNKLVELINEPTERLNQEISSLFQGIKSNLSNETNPAIEVLLTDAINQIEKTYSPRIVALLSNKEDIVNDSILELINTIQADLEARVQSLNNKYGTELRTKVSSAIKSSKENYQNKISLAIEEYLGKFGSKKDSKVSQFSKSGLSFEYADYIKLLTFVMLSGPGRDLILKRIALVINVEMRKFQPSFSILDSYTNFSISSQAKIPIIIGFFADEDKGRIINDELSLGFRR